MSANRHPGEDPNYFSRIFELMARSAAQLVRPPSHSRRAEAARRLARHSLLITAILGVLIVVLMYVLDAREISLMPPRLSPSLWPLRILTDFGKDDYVLAALAGLLSVVSFVSPLLRGSSRVQWLSFGMRVQFLFFAVLTPVLAGAVIKWIVGRGRPFVGGAANPFNFEPFAGTAAYASFPSSHAITAFALAFAVTAVWPRALPAMIVYALVIAGSRLVLLAHHPSDVVAGALVGLLGAMSVRYWFAARRLGFAIHRDGRIVPLRSLWAAVKGLPAGRQPHKKRTPQRGSA
jgi:membrane-associated phospholipid phosphatase